jgi:hypothetical protein
VVLYRPNSECRSLGKKKCLVNIDQEVAAFASNGAERVKEYKQSRKVSSIEPARGD